MTERDFRKEWKEAKNASGPFFTEHDDGVEETLRTYIDDLLDEVDRLRSIINDEEGI